MSSSSTHANNEKVKYVQDKTPSSTAHEEQHSMAMDESKQNPTKNKIENTPYTTPKSKISSKTSAKLNSPTENTTSVVNTEVIKKDTKQTRAWLNTLFMFSAMNKMHSNLCDIKDLNNYYTEIYNPVVMIQNWYRFHKTYKVMKNEYDIQQTQLEIENKLTLKNLSDLPALTVDPAVIIEASNSENILDVQEKSVVDRITIDEPSQKLKPLPIRNHILFFTTRLIRSKPEEHEIFIERNKACNLIVELLKKYSTSFSQVVKKLVK